MPRPVAVRHLEPDQQRACRRRMGRRTADRRGPRPGPARVRPRPGQRRRPLGGRGQQPRRAAHPRPPRRRTGRCRRLAGPAVRRRDRRRLPVGPRRRRHEEHGRDDARGAPRLGPAGPPPTARRRVRVPRRRGGRRPEGRPLPRRQPRRPVRGLHRGDQRGRWLLAHRRRPAALRDRDRREGDRLAAAGREGPRRPRLDAQRRQRGHRSSPRPSPGSGRTRSRSSCRRRSRPSCASCATRWTSRSTPTTSRVCSPSSARSPR